MEKSSPSIYRDVHVLLYVVVERQKKKFYKKKYFTHIPGLLAFLTAVFIDLTVINLLI